MINKQKIEAYTIDISNIVREACGERAFFAFSAINYMPDLDYTTVYCRTGTYKDDALEDVERNIEFQYDLNEYYTYEQQIAVIAEKAIEHLNNEEEKEWCECDM